MRRLSHKLTATAAALMVSASGLVAGSVLRATVAPHLALASCNQMLCVNDIDNNRLVCMYSDVHDCRLANQGMQCTQSGCEEGEDDCEWWQIWCN